MWLGALAELGEHLLCKQGVIGSIPIGSTKLTLLQDETKSYPVFTGSERICRSRL